MAKRFSYNLMEEDVDMCGTAPSDQPRWLDPGDAPEALDQLVDDDEEELSDESLPPPQEERKLDHQQAHRNTSGTAGRGLARHNRKARPPSMHPFSREDLSIGEEGERMDKEGPQLPDLEEEFKRHLEELSRMDSGPHPRLLVRPPERARRIAANWNQHRHDLLDQHEQLLFTGAFFCLFFTDASLPAPTPPIACHSVPLVCVLLTTNQKGGWAGKVHSKLDHGSPHTFPLRPLNTCVESTHLSYISFLGAHVVRARLSYIPFPRAYLELTHLS